MAIEFVEKAVEYGVNKSIFEMQSTYSALQGEASFHSALRKPTLTHELKNVVQLIDPLEMQARGH
jgi:hypothetical protein